MTEFLAIDIGASSGRHILGSVKEGILTIEEIYRFPNGPVLEGGDLVWDISRLEREIIAGMKRAGELGRIPVSVGIDTWAVDYALLGRDNNLLSPVHAYRSDRTKTAIGEVHARIPFEKLYAHTGIQFQPFNTIYQLADDQKRGKLDRAAHMLMLPDYLHYRLTGKMSREYTNATSTGLVNARTRTWDSEILKTLGYLARLFPPLMQPGTKLGRLSDAVRREVGYDTVVTLPATHDTASAVVSSLAGKGAYISSGTWSLLGTLKKEANTSARCREYNYSNEGHLFGGVRLQKNIMGLWIVQRLREEEGKDLSFAQLAALAAENANDAEIDVNDEVFLAPENMKAEIERMAGRSLTLGEAAYCAFRGLAKCYRAAVEELSDVTGEKYDSLNIFGGGSKNQLLNALTAKETGLKVIAGPTEATAIGNLLVQMESMGEISAEDASALVARSFETEEFSA